MNARLTSFFICTMELFSPLRNMSLRTGMCKTFEIIVEKPIKNWSVAWSELACNRCLYANQNMISNLSWNSLGPGLCAGFAAWWFCLCDVISGNECWSVRIEYNDRKLRNAHGFGVWLQKCMLEFRTMDVIVWEESRLILRLVFHLLDMGSRIHWLIFQTECRLQTHKYPAAGAARWMVFVVISRQALLFLADCGISIVVVVDFPIATTAALTCRVHSFFNFPPPRPLTI